MTTRPQVIVVGAGPVGLLCALALAKREVAVLVLEAAPALTVDLRAGTYHPPSLEMMAPYGITGEMLKTAIPVPRWQIRDKREGVIVGYTVRLRPDATPDEIRAWTSIRVEGRQNAVVAALLGEPGVAALHDTNGRWDLLAELRVANLAEMSQVLERIRKVPGVSATETSMHLQTFRG